MEGLRYRSCRAVSDVIITKSLLDYPADTYQQRSQSILEDRFYNPKHAWSAGPLEHIVECCIDRQFVTHQFAPCDKEPEPDVPH